MTLEPLDGLCCNPSDIYTCSLVEDMIKALSDSMGGELPSDFAESVRASGSCCPDLQLFYVFSLAACNPRCKGVLIQFNRGHQRTEPFIAKIGDALSKVIRTIRLPGDSDPGNGGWSGEVSTPIEVAAYYRKLYFTVY